MAISRNSLGRPRFGLSRYIKGPALEIGPGVAPFPVPPGTKRILAERKFDGSIVELFPELGPEAVAPEGDVYLDLDKDGLRMFAPDSLGSIIVSHVLEHTANPLRALTEIYRTLEIGGRAIIALPDRRLTFDRARPGTTVSHLVSEFASNVTEVADDHIIEFCQLVEGRASSEISASLIAHHRKRSIHAHCWTAEEFLAALLYLTKVDELRFDLIDFMGIEHSLDGGSDEEFVFVLEKVRETSLTRMLSQWADCISSNRLTDEARIPALVENLLNPLSLFLPTRAPENIDVAFLLQTWLSHRDLRAFECPLTEPNALAKWAIENSHKDARAASILSGALLDA